MCFFLEIITVTELQSFFSFMLMGKTLDIFTLKISTLYSEVYLLQGTVAHFVCLIYVLKSQHYSAFYRDD